MQPAQVEAGLACRSIKTDGNTKKVVVKSQIFRASAEGVDGVVDSQSKSKCLNKVKRVGNTGNKLANVNIISSCVENASECKTGVH